MERFQAECTNYGGVGYSIAEASHRGALYTEVHNRVLEKIRTLLAVPSSHEVLLLAGGATLQFAMVPYNVGENGAYIVAGQWGQKAYHSARAVGAAREVYNGASDTWRTLPLWKDIRCRPPDTYLHLTSNETVNGLQWHRWPTEPLPPLVADMSSDIMSREIPLDRFGLIYAGAQKNMGIAGVTVVIVRPDLLVPRVVPPYLDYRTHIKARSLYNTPPTIAIYTMGLVLDWIEELGGVEAMQRRNAAKAGKLYEALDSMGDFYTNRIEAHARSQMSVIFTLGDEHLTPIFLSEAEERGFVGLKGHRSVGGCRVSLYNAIEERAVDTLIAFMRDFARRYG